MVDIENTKILETSLRQWREHAENLEVQLADWKRYALQLRSIAIETEKILPWLNDGMKPHSEDIVKLNSAYAALGAKPNA